MSIPTRYKPLNAGKVNHATIDAAVQFLTEIWDYDGDAYTFIETRFAGRWKKHPIKGNRASQISKILREFSPEQHDVYFCLNAFSEPRRKRVFALPTRYAHCDIDHADPSGYDPQPNILWETSPGRFQGVWIWNKPSKGRVAEQYSKNIVYKDGGDKGGWSITKMLRLPGTINHKSDYKRPVVTLRSFDTTRQKLPKSISAIEPDRLASTARNLSGSIDEIDPFKHEPKEVIEKYRRRLEQFPRILLTAKRVLYRDKSKAIYAAISDLVRLSATNDEIAAALRDNPHFTERENMTLDDLCADILRIRAKREAGQ